MANLSISARQRVGRSIQSIGRRQWAILCAAAGAVSLAALPAVAANTDNWKGGSSDWNNAANWSSGVIPGTGDTVNVTGTNGVSFVVTYDYTGTAVTPGTLTVDLTNGTGTSAATLSMSANALSISGNETIGQSGAGVFNQGGGSNSLNSGATLFLAKQSSASGTYNLSGGSLFGSGGEYVGFAGSGTFTQTGGSNNSILVSLGTSGTGTYSLSGTGFLSATNEYIGDGGRGVFFQSSSQNICSNELDIGRSAGGTGSYTISGTGAELVAENGMYVGGSSGGAGGTGILTINAGANVGVGALQIYSGAGNAINLNGGEISAASFNFNNNFSLFHWNSGTLEITGTDEIIDSTGIANLSSALSLQSGQSLIVINNEFVGGNSSGSGGGSGTVTQNGGSNTILSGALKLAGNPGTSGTYTLSGTGAVSVPMEVVGNSGSATFNQSGGSNDVTGNFIVAQNSGSSGTYLLSGSGSVAANGEYIGGGTASTGGIGMFNQTGGTNTVSGNVFSVGSSGGSGTFVISGGVATLHGDGYDGGNSSSYSTAGKGTITVTGTGLLNVGGTLHVLAGSGSVVNLTGGEIETGALDLQGNYSTLNWTGGTLALTNTNVTLDSTLANTSDPLGPSVTLLSGQTLILSGSETIGGSGPGSLTINSGASHVVSGAITLNSDGILTDNGSLTFGSFVQAGGIVNGNLQNAGTFTYQNGVFNGRLINDGSVSLGNNFTAGNGVENDATMQISANQTLTVNGEGLDNLGNFNLYGTLNGSGAILNDFGGVLYVQGGTINDAFTNDGTVNLGGLFTANTGTNNNYGLISTGSGTFRSGTLNNFGVVNLGGGAVSGTVSNSAGGLIEGGGGLSGAVTNGAGAVILANSATVPLIFTNFQGNNSGAQIEVANNSTLEINDVWTNLGLVSLLGSGAILGNSAFTNSGTISGAGEVSSFVTNNDTIRATGGQLMLASGLTNPSSGQLQAGTGSTIFVASGFSSNAGEIALGGGAFDDNNQPLTNTSTGLIAGNGTFRSGGLTNQGTISFADQPTSVYGNLTTATVGSGTGVVNITNNTTTFYGSVTIGTQTTFNVNQATARFLSGFTNNGIYHTDPSTTITTNMNIGSQGAIVAGAGDLYQVSGNYTNASTQSGIWSTTGAELEFTGGGTHQLTATGAAASSPWGTLAVDSGNTVVLSNGNKTSHVNALQLTGSAVLDVTNNGIAIDYAGTPDPVATIVAYLSSGYNGGTWSGTSGIISSIAASGQSSPLLSVGYADGNVDSGTAAAANQVLVKYTLAGDANLDGSVNFTDLGIVGQHLNTTGNDWAHGNFTYAANGAVNFTDLGIVGQNLNKLLTPAASSGEEVGGATVGIGGSPTIQGSAVVLPEPGEVALAFTLTAGTLARRRRRAWRVD